MHDTIRRKAIMTTNPTPADDDDELLEDVGALGALINAAAEIPIEGLAEARDAAAAELRAKHDK